MQVKLFPLIFFALCYNCSMAQDAQSSATPNSDPDSQTSIENRDSTENPFTEAFIALIESADTMAAFHLEEWAVDTSDSSFYGYKTIAHQGLTLEQLDSFQNLLLDESNYVIDQVAKRCEFGPNIGFYVGNDTEEAIILVALNCDIIRIVYNGLEIVKEDIDPSHQAWVSLGNSIFPDAFTFYANTAN
ncbi:MAG: hypothetical protein AAFV95_24070 [Bacteroidota bacterium]